MNLTRLSRLVASVTLEFCSRLFPLFLWHVCIDSFLRISWSGFFGFPLIFVSIWHSLAFVPGFFVNQSYHFCEFARALKKGLQRSRHG